MKLKQYLVVLVNLDPTIGSEVKKTRPCLILSPNEMNENIDTIIVAPITSASRNYPTRVEIKEGTTKGWVMLDQIRAIDKNRIIKKFEIISHKEIMQVKNTIKELLVD